MSVGLFALVAVGGGLGATLRFTVDGFVTRRVGAGFPWGTFLVNASGSLLLGVLTGLADSSLLDAPWLVVLGGGVLGGYTTFSTAMVDVVGMIRDRRPGAAAGNALGMLAVTVLLALAGLALGRAL